MGVGVFCDEFQGHEVDPDECITTVMNKFVDFFFFFCTFSFCWILFKHFFQEKPFCNEKWTPNVNYNLLIIKRNAHKGNSEVDDWNIKCPQA